MKFRRNMAENTFTCFRCGSVLLDQGETLAHPQLSPFKAIKCPFKNQSVPNPDVFDICPIPERDEAEV